MQDLTWTLARAKYSLQVARNLELGFHAKLPDGRGSARGAPGAVRRYGHGNRTPGVRPAGNAPQSVEMPLALQLESW